MSQNNYFYKMQPINGATTLLHFSEILTEIQMGKMSLMHLFWINSFQHIYAFQIPIVNNWMIATFSPFMNTVDSTEIPFSSFNSHEKSWYVYRKEKDNLFGPMPFSEILKIKNNNYIFENDFCCSFKENAFFYALKLPEIQISPKEKEQPFYFQRRNQRFNELYPCKLMAQINAFEYSADLVDFSENGAAIYLDLELQVDDVLELTITANTKTFKHKAKIRSMKKDNGRIRYGLFILDNSSATLKCLKNEKKAA